MSRMSCVGMLCLWLAAPAAAEENLQGFALRMIRHDEDWQLAAERSVCAFGELSDVHAKMIAKGASSKDIPPIHVYCLAVLAEAARRDQLGVLFVELQPDAASNELDAILSAAGNNATEFRSMSGDVKPLPCELAFDAGYVLAHQNPALNIAPQATAATIDAVTKACFDPETATSTRNGLIAGAKQALRAIAP